MIRRWPHLRELHEEAQRQQTTPAYSGMPGGGGDGRGLERGVVRAMSSCEAREFEAVDAAIRATMTLSTGELRMALVDLVFWRQTHTVDGAALHLHCSPRTGREWHRCFIRLVAQKYGLLD